METINPRAIAISMEVEEEAILPIQTVHNSHFEVTLKEESVFKCKSYNFGNLPTKCPHKYSTFFLKT